VACRGRMAFQKCFDGRRLKKAAIQLLRQPEAALRFLCPAGNNWRNAITAQASSGRNFSMRPFLLGGELPRSMATLPVATKGQQGPAWPAESAGISRAGEGAAPTALPRRGGGAQHLGIAMDAQLKPSAESAGDASGGRAIKGLLALQFGGRPEIAAARLGHQGITSH